MTTENLVTIDFDSEIVNNNNEIDVNEKNQNNSNFHSQEIDLIPDVSFKDQHHNLEDLEALVGESQPLLGGDHDQHQITYNQFPGKKSNSRHRTSLKFILVKFWINSWIGLQYFHR